MPAQNAAGRFRWNYCCRHHHRSWRWQISRILEKPAVDSRSDSPTKLFVSEIPRSKKIGCSQSDVLPVAGTNPFLRRSVLAWAAELVALEPVRQANRLRGGHQGVRRLKVKLNWQSSIESETKIPAGVVSNHSKCSESAEFCSFEKPWAWLAREVQTACKSMISNGLLWNRRTSSRARPVWPRKCNFVPVRKEAVTK
jgi:hypothetical protein